MENILSPEDLQFLRELANEMKTQKDRLKMCTASPYYFVLQLRKDLPAPDGYGDGEEVYVDWEGDPSTYPNKGEFVQCMRENGYTDKEIEERWEKVERFDQHKVYEDENIFFTEKGYERHMKLNGHNYRGYKHSPRYYIRHAFRNPELQRIQEIILKFADKEAVDEVR